MALRDRKKAKTRAAIQRHALRLFREQGYEATTVSQIAAAAEISDSTFFRYFPTKEDVVVWDDLDPEVIAATLSQPPELGPIAAVRAGLRDVLMRMSPIEQTELRERVALALSIRPVWVHGASRWSQPLELLAGALAERSGRTPDEPGVRALVGAVVGACVAVLLSGASDPKADLAALVDRALAELEGAR